MYLLQAKHHPGLTLDLATQPAIRATYCQQQSPHNSASLASEDCNTLSVLKAASHRLFSAFVDKGLVDSHFCHSERQLVESTSPTVMNLLPVTVTYNQTNAQVVIPLAVAYLWVKQWTKWSEGSVPCTSTEATP